MSKSQYAALPLMVVEDSDEDFEALARALRKIGMADQIVRCLTVEHCLTTLDAVSKSKEDERQQLPGLILLDLNLPGGDGYEVIQAVKGSSKFKKIPVTVLTTSTNPKDVDVCYECGANAYVVKPLDYDDFTQTVKSMTNFWFRTVVLPSSVS